MSGINVLLVEDSPADVYMLKEAFEYAGLDYALTVVRDGVAATDFLYHRAAYQSAPAPQLIILDVNLPLKSGREVLAEITPDPDLRQIPLVILTGSATERDIVEVFGLSENCYMVKPGSFEEYVAVAKAIEAFRRGAMNCPVPPVSR